MNLKLRKYFKWHIRFSWLCPHNSCWKWRSAFLLGVLHWSSAHFCLCNHPCFSHLLILLRLYSSTLLLHLFSATPYPRLLPGSWLDFVFLSPSPLSFIPPLFSPPSFSLVASSLFTDLFFLFIFTYFLGLGYACLFFAQGSSVTRSLTMLWICRHFLELWCAPSHHILWQYGRCCQLWF